MAHRTAGPGSKGALEVQEGGPHARIAGDPAGGLAGTPVGQALDIGQVTGVQRPRHRFRRGRVVEGSAGIQHAQSHGAVEQAGIQMRQPPGLRQPGGDGALARGGGSVDGDDERWVHGRGT